MKKNLFKLPKLPPVGAMRIPKDAYNKLRHNSAGAHTTQKGKKGYKREDGKKIQKEDF